MTATLAPPETRSRFKPATRKKTKLRLALDGPAGSGKTYTLLRFAFALGQRVAVIDSEHGSASLYQGISPDGVPWNFDVLELDSFSPSDYTAAIEEAARCGYDVIVVDSLSHAWTGKDGALELVSKKGGNSFTAWKDVTPMHTRMIETILAVPLHVLVSMRSKVEYVLEKDEKGREVPRKVGMAPIQRAGMEYEFSLYGSMDWSHVMTVTKTRCEAVDGAIVVKPGPAFIEPVIRWLETGESVRFEAPVRSMVSDAQIERIVQKIVALGRTIDSGKKEIFKRYTAAEFNHLTIDQARDYEARLDIELRNKTRQATPQSKSPQGGQATAPDANTQASSVPPPNGQAAGGAHNPAPAAGQSATPPPVTTPTQPPQSQQEAPPQDEKEMLLAFITNAVQQQKLTRVNLQARICEVNGGKTSPLKRLGVEKLRLILAGITGKQNEPASTKDSSTGDPVNNTTFGETLHALPQAQIDAGRAAPDGSPVRINALFEHFAGMNEWSFDVKSAAWAKVIAKRGVKSLAGMSDEQRLELSKNLAAQIAAKHAELGTTNPFA